MRTHLRHDAMAYAEKLPDSGADLSPGRASLDVAAGRLDLTVHTRMAPAERAWRKLEADPWNSLHQGYEWCRAWVETHGNPLAIVEGRLNGEIALLTQVSTATILSSWMKTRSPGMS